MVSTSSWLSMRTFGASWEAMSLAAWRASSVSTMPYRASEPSADSTVTWRPASPNCSSIRALNLASGKPSVIAAPWYLKMIVAAPGCTADARNANDSLASRAQSQCYAAGDAPSVDHRRQAARRPGGPRRGSSHRSQPRMPRRCTGVPARQRRARAGSGLGAGDGGPSAGRRPGVGRPVAVRDAPAGTARRGSVRRLAVCVRNVTWPKVSAEWS